VSSSNASHNAPIDAKTGALTLAALTGFAANSLLCRMALREARIDASSFTLVRLASGAIVLALLARITANPRAPASSGSWRAGAALFAYAIAFSFAYLRLGASVGALVLFGVVQTTMIVGGLRAGERPRAQQWVGLAVAFAGLIALNLPGLSAPDPLGAGLMAIAGVAWGVYSLLGRGCANPLAATADNFMRSVPLAVIASLLSLQLVHTSPRGLAPICGRRWSTSSRCFFVKRNFFSISIAMRSRLTNPTPSLGNRSTLTIHQHPGAIDSTGEPGYQDNSAKADQKR